MSRAKQLGFRVFRGMEATLIAQVGVLGANLLLTPLLVRGLGTGGYGLFTLMWTLQEYLLLATLGTIDGTKKFAAQFHGTREHARLGALLRSALTYQAAAGLVAFAVAYFGRHWLAAQFGDPSSGLLVEAAWLFGCVAAGTPAYFVFYFTASVIFGQQRWRTLNGLMATHSIAVAAISVILLARGYGLREIGAAYVAVQLFYALLSGWLAREAIFAGRTPLRVGDEKDFYGFSLKSLLAQIMTTLASQGDRLFIVKFLTLAELGYYVIASSLAQKFNNFCVSVTLTVFPIFTELASTGQEQRLRRFYLKATELSLFLLMPAAIMACVLAPQFLTLWLGADFSDYATWPMRWLVLGNFAFMSTMLPNKLAISKNYPQVGGYLQSVKTVWMIALWAVLIPSKGIIGAAYGLCIAEWTTAPIFITYCHRKFLGLGWLEFVGAFWRPAVVGAALAALGFYTHAEVTTWPRLIAYAAAAMGLYYGVGFRLLERGARDQLLAWLKEKLNI